MTKGQGTMSNLLVVDWDYFFPNPLEGGFNLTEKDLYLYDWGHREAEFYIDMVWGSRATGFLMHDLPLPTVTDAWRTFPDRFNVTDDAIVYYADSNVHSGLIESTDGEPFENVWLYDAHHDSGYSVDSFEKWMKQHVSKGSINFSCEDWMLVHYMAGSDLHWRIPTWHESFKKRVLEPDCTDAECDMGHVAHGPFWPKGVTLDAAVDDMEEVDEEFDTVFICRSGAWVPPWEDDKFMEFVESWNCSTDQLDGGDLVRQFDVREIKQQAKIIAESVAKMNV
jgi:hypothetical protein